MKVGDLVQLSAYSKGLSYHRRRRKDIGIVVAKIHNHFFSVMWCSDGAKSLSMDRRELKYVKQERSQTI